MIIILSVSLFSSEYVEGEVLFKTFSPFSQIDIVNDIVQTEQEWFNQISSTFRISSMDIIIKNIPEFNSMYIIGFNDSIDVSDVVSSLEDEIGKVDYAEPNYIYQSMTNDPLYSSQWAHENINSEDAWGITSGDNDILIAVLDSGVDFTHPDLQGDNVIWNLNGQHGINVIENQEEVYDWSGHGTMVTGVIRAITNNNTDIAGLAGGGFNNEIGCKILPIRISGYDPNVIFTDDIAIGLAEAILFDADVINMSFGGSNWNNTISYVIEYAYASYGIPLIAAAGNGGSEELSFPARHPNVLSVGATDADDKKSYYSQFDHDLDVCAPGGFGIEDWTDIEDVVTLTPSYDEIPNNPGQVWYYRQLQGCDLETAFCNGTSISAPYVSALAGLILSDDNTLTPDEVYDRIKGTADRIDTNSPFYAGKLGGGRINAFRALDDDPQPSMGFYDLEVDFEALGDYEANAGDTNIPIRFSFRNFWMDYVDVDVTLSSSDPGIIVEPGTVFNYTVLNNVDIFTTGTYDITITDDAYVGWHNIQLEFVNNTYSYSIDCPIQIYPGNVLGNGYTIIGQTETSPLITNLNYLDDEEIIVATKNVLTDHDAIHIIDDDGSYTIYLEEEGYVNIHGRLAAGDLSRNEEDRLFDEIVIPGENGELWVIFNDEELRGAIYPNAQYHTTFGNDPLYVSIGNVNDDEFNEVIVITEDNTLGIFSWDAFGDRLLDLLYEEDFSGETFFPVSVGDMDGDGIDEIILSNDTQQSGYITKISYVIDHYESELILTQNTPRCFMGPSIMADINTDIISNNELFTAYSYLDNTDLYMRGIYETFSSQGSNINVYDNLDFKSMDYKRFSGCYTNDVSTDAPRLFANGQNNLIMFDRNLNIVSESNGLFFSNYPLLGVNSTIMNNEKYYIFNNEKEIVISDDDLNIIDGLHFITSNRYVGTPVETDFDNDGNADIVFLKQYISGAQYATSINAYRLPYTHSESNVNWQQYAYDKHNSNCYGNIVNSNITSNTIWWKDVVIHGDIKVERDCELVIKPGVKVRFEDNSSLTINGGITAIGNEFVNIMFTSNSHSPSTSYTGLIIEKPTLDCILEYCTIEKAQVGINIYNPLDASVDIVSCLIKNNETGIRIYGGTPQVLSNTIINNNSYGVLYLNGSNIIFESNTLLGNQDIEFFISCSRPLLSNGLNDLWFDDDYTLVMTSTGSAQPLDVSQNWWGTTDVRYINENLINDPQILLIEPICEEPNNRQAVTNYEDSRLLYENGIAQMHSGNYLTAKNIFTNLIFIYPSCNEISLTFSKLLELYIISNDDLSELQDYYTLLLPSYPNYPEHNLLNSLITMCKRKKSEFNDAIADYEFILMNDPTYEDSCYAVIDIGYTYLEAAQQRAFCTGKLSKLEPKSEEQHRKNVETILGTLLLEYSSQPSNENIPNVIQLYNNYPNPFNPTTNISFSIPDESKVELDVYNIRGQKVKTLMNNNLDKGNHSVVWNGVDDSGKIVSSGVYFYKLSVGGKSKAVKKCLMLK